MMRFVPARLLPYATGAAFIASLPATLLAQQPYEPFVACDARVKNVIYVSPASEWGGPAKEGTLVNPTPYWWVWTQALAAVGGDWRDARGCETGNSKAEVEAKIRERARRRYVDSPPIQVLGWELEPGYKAPMTVPAKRADSSAGSLVVEDTGAADRKKAWDDVILQAQRDEATRQVKIAIATAEQKAKNDAMTKKMLAEMRKRGRAQ